MTELIQLPGPLVSLPPSFHSSPGHGYRTSTYGTRLLSDTTAAADANFPTIQEFDQETKRQGAVHSHARKSHYMHAVSEAFWRTLLMLWSSVCSILSATDTNSDRATYSLHAEGTSVLQFLGFTLVTSVDNRLRRARQRGRLNVPEGNPLGIVHDLIEDSFGENIYNQKEVPQLIKSTHAGPLTGRTSLAMSSTNFLSAFTETATWTTTVDGIGQMTSMSPEAVFLRFRFPAIHFEWVIRNSRFELNRLHSAPRPRHMMIHLDWCAISSASETVPATLIATGTVTDRIAIISDNFPIIERRRFRVANIILPELMRPRPLPLERPTIRRVYQAFMSTGSVGSQMDEGLSTFPVRSQSKLSSSTRPNVAAVNQPPSDNDPRMAFEPREKFIGLLRSSRIVITFVVAFSAAMASTQPLVSQTNPEAGIILAIVGVVSACASIASLVIGKVIMLLEMEAVKIVLTMNATSS